MGPSDPFTMLPSEDVDTDAPASGPGTDAAATIHPGSDRRRIAGTAIGASIGLGFGLLVLYVGFWTALALALLAGLGAGLGRLVGARRAAATSRRIFHAVTSRP